MKHIVITGANRGLGLEFVRQYLEEGACVTAICRTSSPELAATDCRIITADLSNPEGLLHVTQELGDQAIDTLILNAGVYRHLGTPAISAENFEKWHASFAVNAIAPLLLAQALLPHLKQAKSPVIAALTSKMGSIGDNTSGGSLIYRSSKAAMNASFRSLALDLEPEGIHVVLLHPGWVLTDMGGPNALITPETSIKGMRKVITGTTTRPSGQFLAYDGTSVPW